MTSRHAARFVVGDLIVITERISPVNKTNVSVDVGITFSTHNTGDKTADLRICIRKESLHDAEGLSETVEFVVELGTTGLTEIMNAYGHAFPAYIPLEQLNPNFGRSFKVVSAPLFRINDPSMWKGDSKRLDAKITPAGLKVWGDWCDKEGGELWLNPSSRNDGQVWGHCRVWTDEGEQ